MANTLEDLVKSYLQGGSLHAIPQTIAEPYLVSVAEGEVAGHVPWSKNGHTAGAGTSETDVWTGATSYSFPAAEMGMEVVSTDNTNDKEGGTGALTVKIYYLTLLGVAKTETVTLNGTAAVATVATDIYRVNNFVVASTGTSGKAAGTISLRHLSDTPTYAQISAGYTRDRSSIYTVPAGKVLYVTSLAVSTLNASADKGARITLRATYDDLADAATTPGVLFMPYFEIAARNGTFMRTFELPLRFVAGTDIKTSVTAEAASTTCTIGLRGWLESED